MMNYENNLDQNNFYFEGFKILDLRESAESINKFLLKYDSANIRSDDDWQEKYDKTFDLKLDKILDNSIFMNFISENKIFEQLEELTGFKYEIGDIIVRKTFSQKSYMPWHRDTYLHRNSAVGRTPPLIKLIYYPKFNTEERVQLKIKKWFSFIFCEK